MIELITKFGDWESVIILVRISFPGLWLEFAILMVRDLVSTVGILTPESDASSSMFKQ